MIFDIILLASKFHANVVYSYLLLRTNWPLAKTETGMAGVVASKVRRQRSKNSGPNPGLRDGREEWEKRRQVSRLLQSEKVIDVFLTILPTSMEGGHNPI